MGGGANGEWGEGLGGEKGGETKVGMETKQKQQQEQMK